MGDIRLWTWAELSNLEKETVKAIKWPATDESAARWGRVSQKTRMKYKRLYFERGTLEGAPIDPERVE